MIVLESRTGSNVAPASGLMISKPWQDILELLVFFFLSLGACSYQVSGAPNLALLFDSLGYMWVADALQHGFKTDILIKFVHYIASAFSELERWQLKDSLVSLLDICKTGPVLPLILCGAFSLAGKAISTQHWQIASLSMIVMQALTVSCIWLWSRYLWGKGISRLAAVIAVTYPGFLINAGRVLSEIPAVAIGAGSLMIFSIILLEEWKKSTKQKYLAYRFFKGLLIGAALALLMLARPTLIFLPALLLAGVFILSKKMRVNNLMNGQLMLGLVAGAVLLLSPWLACKYILTGEPSVLVNRYGAWNLYAGCNIQNDGWDALPSTFVSHPDQFKTSMGEVVKKVVFQFKEHPFEFLNLLLRKPGRLMEAPWNDFQINCYGIPFLIQKWWHQCLIFAALFGFMQLMQAGIKTKDFSKLLTAFVMGSMVAYHLNSCLFITMSRYFIPAIPCIILLASYGLWTILKIPSIPKKTVLSLAVIFVPCLSTGLGCLAANKSIACFISAYGVPAVAGICSMIFVLGCVFAVCVLAFLTIQDFWCKTVFLLLGLSIAICGGISRFYELSCLNTVVDVTCRQQKFLVRQILSKAEIKNKQWFLVLDAQKQSGNRTQGELFQELIVQLNGDTIQVNWRPLLAQDTSRRENLLYQTAFAYCAGKRVEDFHQWFCAPLPADCLRSDGINMLKLYQKNNPEEKIQILADFSNSCGNIFHSVAFRQFSWTKGFFANCPGEMRLDTWNTLSAIVGRKSSVTGVCQPDKYPDLEKLMLSSKNLINTPVPRIFLLGVESLPVVCGQELMNSKIPGQKVGLGFGERIKEVQIDTRAAIKNIGPCVLHIVLCGKVRSLKPGGQASIGLIEGIERNTNNAEEFAPRAPLSISCTPQWQEFKIEDLVPLNNNLLLLKDKEITKLQYIRLLFAARSWWEVLSYAIYKGQTPVEFKDMELKITTEPLTDLDYQSWRVIPLVLQDEECHAGQSTARALP